MIATKSSFIKEGVIKSNTTLSPREVILSLLRARNWTKVRLATEIGISKQALHNYLTGRWRIPTQTKIKIAQILEVDSAVIWDLEFNHALSKPTIVCESQEAKPGSNTHIEKSEGEL